MDGLSLPPLMITQQNNYCLYKKLRNDMELVYYIYLHGEKGHTWSLHVNVARVRYATKLIVH